LKDNETVVEEIKGHLLEDPKHILEVKDEEVKAERYLTKEERAIKEEEDRKRRAFEEAMRGDTLQQRGLKSMLGGNELNLKKDKNKVQDLIEPEEWMSKPEEQMNEDEKSRWEDFKKRRAEQEEKYRKAWKQDQKRLEAEVQSLKERFEEDFLKMYKRRLFYQARIYEQELYIIRLVIMLSDVKQTAENIAKFNSESSKLEQEFQEKDEQFKQVLQYLSEFDQKIKTDQGIFRQDQDITTWCQSMALNVSKIKEFIKKGKAAALVKLKDTEKAKMIAHIKVLDPFKEIDKTEADAMIAE